jgi:pimeloyl-ACP methyl ester carboxylesterase
MIERTNMSRVITTNGTELAYDTIGAPGAPTLLLIQGLGAQYLGWRSEFCEELASRGFRVVRFDNRDVGRSQRFPSTEYTVADMADDAAGLLEALDLGPAHVVGQSMGGMIAQELVLRHPDLVLSLGLVYTSATRDRLVGRVAVERRSGASEPVTRNEAIERYVEDERVCASTSYPQDEAWLRTLGGQMYDRGLDPAGVERQTAAVLRSPDRSARLRTVRTPTLLLAGDADQLIDPTASAELNALIEDSRLTVFPGMGHEFPRALWGTITAALESNARRAVSAVTP